MEALNFSINHNGKLFLEFFSAVRLHNPAKYAVGKILECNLQSQKLGLVEVVAIRSFEYRNISDVLSYLDTGKPAYQMGNLLKKFYPKHTHAHAKFDHIVLHYVERNMPVLQVLLEEWYRDIAEQHKSDPSIQSGL